MFSFADVPMFLMVLMPKGRQTIHGIANEHITGGDDGTACAIRPDGPTRARLAPVAAEQRQDILAREQCRRDAVAAEHAVDQIALGLLHLHNALLLSLIHI